MDLDSFYENCRDKWGFQDGEQQTYGCYVVRDQLVRLINDNAPADADIEAFAYNRPGMHNSCMIGYRHKRPDPRQATIEGVETQFPKDEWLPMPPWVPDILAHAEENDIMPLQMHVTINLDRQIPKSWAFGEWCERRFRAGKGEAAMKKTPVRVKVASPAADPPGPD